MITSHEFAAGSDARVPDSYDRNGRGPNIAHLVVTSPPYPMIAMWDRAFTAMDPEIGELLRKGDGPEAFERMHRQLDRVWHELFRILVPGGIMCINIGDATRTAGGVFRLYPNHVRIVSACLNTGFDMLPEILWRKPNNSPTKFMGSGMLPPRAYVTYEHEYILVFRKPGNRNLSESDIRRRRNRSAYFWEERNAWFTDLWEFTGIRQGMGVPDAGPLFTGMAGQADGKLTGEDTGTLRERSAAFPFELPYRLIHMFSLQEDTVMDPFGGTGTTMLAAMAACRNSYSVEWDESFLDVATAALPAVVEHGRRRIRERLGAHRAFLAGYMDRGKQPKYENSVYGFPVVTRQERDMGFPVPESLREAGKGAWEVEYGEPRQDQ